MENLIPILIIGAIYFYNVYKKFKEEQAKHQQRKTNRPHAVPVPQREVQQQRVKTPASPSPVIYGDLETEVLDPWTDYVKKEKKRPTASKKVSSAQEIQKINKNLPKIDLEVVELQGADEEIHVLDSSFDLRDAVIKSAILHRPKV